MLTTHTKITLARLVQAPILAARNICGLGSYTRVKRRGIYWNLDLREGIDFAIFLLGAFEPDTLKVFRRLVHPGMTVLDIGANIGAHTLHLGRLVGTSGRVVAFEPTTWAFDKLMNNLALNPKISAQVTPRQVMLMGDSAQAVPENIPSSWPLKSDQDVHPKLRGRDMATTGSIAMTVDSFLSQTKANKIDFIKLDVDGYECDVLSGMPGTLQKERPIILMELSPYVLIEKGHSIQKLMDILDSAGYRLFHLDGQTPLPWMACSLHDLVPDGAGINVLAKPIG